MSKASWRWASSPRASATEASASSSIERCVARARRAARRRARRAGRRWRRRARGPEVATTVGRPRRSGASSRTSSWTSVAMWTSSIAVAARTAVVARLLAGAEQDQQRPQPLAARRRGSRRRPRRAARRGPSTCSAQPILDLARRAGSQRLEASRTAVTGGGTAERSRHPRDAAVDRDDPAGEDRVSGSARSRRASIFSARPRGSGKLRTDSGR